VLAALEAAYRDGSWGKYYGVYVERLEAKLAEYHGLPFALTCGSGTFAVELALRALKIGAGHEVILSAYDYPGNFLNIHAVGAMPVLVDVDAENWNLSASRLAHAIGPATKAILVSHLHGGVVPMREVTALAAERGIAVIEDAAQMPGALIQSRKAGAWGDIGILSFGGSKLLTAGRGGALVTQHAGIHQRARTWLNRGNHLCPLSELQAAVLLPQLGKLDTQNATRARNVALLRDSLRTIPGIAPFRNHCEETEPGYYKLGIQLDYVRFGLLRERFLDAVRAEGIAVDTGFNALHVGRSPNRFRRVGDLAEAERAHHQTVVLHHPVLLGTPADVEEVALAIAKIYANAGRLAGAAQAR
jgi:dTDP-4-amino-4,6-dideoxygalactose transaminase